MPNIVEYNGDHYFVIDMKADRHNRITYLLDNGLWVRAEKVTIVD